MPWPIDRLNRLAAALQVGLYVNQLQTKESHDGGKLEVGDEIISFEESNIG